MSKPVSKAIYKIAEKNESDKIVIFTNHLMLMWKTLWHLVLFRICNFYSAHPAQKTTLL